MKRLIALLGITFIFFATPSFVWADDSGNGSGGGSTDTPNKWEENIDHMKELADSLDLMGMGLNFFEEEIDDVIFQTNSFLTNNTFIGKSGPFWWILQICLILSSMFSLILAANMAFKMMIKHEPLDALLLLKPLAVSFVLAWWYPPSLTGETIGGATNSNDCFLDILAVIPNAIGSYTKDLYEIESLNIRYTYQKVNEQLSVRDQRFKEIQAQNQMAAEATKNVDNQQQQQIETAEQAQGNLWQSSLAGVVIFIDKLLMFIAILVYRIGWWAIIYSQQIILGVLTIFGPIHWAASLLPKWSNAWSKWIGRYLTVHMYGAMLYFVGFYVLLLFDIVLNIQYEDLSTMLVDNASLTAFLKDSFFTTGYLMAASCVSLKCLGIVPDLAAWIIPEGEISMSARSFGDGLGSEMKRNIGGALNGNIGSII